MRTDSVINSLIDGILIMGGNKVAKDQLQLQAGCKIAQFQLANANPLQLIVILSSLL